MTEIRGVRCRPLITPLFLPGIPAQGAERNPLDLPEPNYINTGKLGRLRPERPIFAALCRVAGRGRPEPTDFQNHRFRLK